MKVITVKPGPLRGTVDIPKLSGEDSFYAAYFLVAGAIGNDIFCRGISEGRIIDIIKSAGGEIKYHRDGISARRTAIMHGISVDAGGIEDIIPAVAVLCAFCPGESRIYNASALKNSEILKGIAAEFSHLGIETALTSDGIVIHGRQVINSDGTYVWNSSTLAAALMIMASRAEGEVRILGTDNLSDDRFDKFMKIYEKLKEEMRYENNGYKRTEP